ncbi:hypothetical protein C8Q73DRAFT_297369 [Cubamyces lactineus]|nr:hypothetical protein C8Q73DRAFT_297369 [Cubamyces lactineus]
MIVAIISIILVVLDVLTVTPYSPLPPGFLSIGSVFSNPHLFDRPITIGAPIITVPGLPGLRSGSVDPNSFLFGILPIPTVESYPPPFEHTTPVEDPYVDFFAYQPSTFAGLWVDLQTLTRIDPVHLILERGVVLRRLVRVGRALNVIARRRFFRIAVRLGWVPARVGVKPNWKYRFPPPPTSPVTTPAIFLNFSILNDEKVTWSRRKRRRLRRSLSALSYLLSSAIPFSSVAFWQLSRTSSLGTTTTQPTSLIFSIFTHLYCRCPRRRVSSGRWGSRHWPRRLLSGLGLLAGRTCFPGSSDQRLT